MNIGFVTTWFERGGAYVMKQYYYLLKNSHSIFIYARGGEKFAENDPNWDWKNVTWGDRLDNTRVIWRSFKKWVKKNNIEIIFFNEQKDLEILYLIRKYFPKIIIGTYIDYYKLNTIEDFELYDFLVCNTKRHFSVFKNHPQVYYLPWGTDIDIFKPIQNNNQKLVFFHSMGMAKRKGTDLLIESFIDGKLYEESELIIHTQIDLNKYFNFNQDKFQNYNITIINRSVSAPGLYYMGDVYVYPTYLDGLGLTIYEALSSGLPVIATNVPPINEIINEDNGSLIGIIELISRSDGYYWPLAIPDKEELIKTMQDYISSYHQIDIKKEKARKFAEENLNWNDRRNEVNRIFTQVKKLQLKDLNKKYTYFKKKQINNKLNYILKLLPDYIQKFYYNRN